MKIMSLLVASLLSVAAAPSFRDGEPIPLSRYGAKQFTVEAEVAGRKRTFLFDTGEGVTMVSPALAKEIGCDPWGNVTAFRMLGERLDLNGELVARVAVQLGKAA